MAFMKQLHHQMAQEKQTTENGAVGYHTSGKHLLDANFAVSSMRNWSEQRIVKLFAKVCIWFSFACSEKTHFVKHCFWRQMVTDNLSVFTDINHIEWVKSVLIIYVYAVGAIF